MADRDRKNNDKINDIIKDLEDLVEKSKPSPLSSSKIVVNKEELLSLIRELRMKAPDEIKRYRKMLENKDAIMADAENRAEKMLEEARLNIQNLVDEHEIVQQALAEADEIMADATNQANELMYQAQRESEMMHKGAVKYMADNLNKLQALIDGTMNNFETRYRGMMNTMEKYSALVKENKEELMERNEDKSDHANESDQTQQVVQQQNKSAASGQQDVQVSETDFV